jgi:hypothetical protein
MRRRALTNSTESTSIPLPTTPARTEKAAAVILVVVALALGEALAPAAADRAATLHAAVA